MLRKKSIALLTEEGFNIKIVTLAEGLDPDDIFRDHGPQPMQVPLMHGGWQSEVFQI